MVNVLTLTVCPDEILALSKVMSPPPPVAVTVPWMWHVVPPESFTRKCAAVPVPEADPLHVPLIALDPDDAAAIQSEGQLISTSNVPLSAAAQFAGGEPVLIRSLALVPIVVSI